MSTPTTGGNSAERREKFVAAYVLSQNATAAAKAAGYSDHAAYSQGHRLLKRAEIQAEIERRLALARAPALEAAAALGVSKAKLVAELAPLAFSSMKRLLKRDAEDRVVVDEAGRPALDFAAISDADWKCIKKLKFERGYPVIELYDRRQAAFDLAQILGYVVQKLNVRKVQSLDDLDDEELSRLAAGAPADLDTGDQRAN